MIRRKDNLRRKLYLKKKMSITCGEAQIIKYTQNGQTCMDYPAICSSLYPMMPSHTRWDINPSTKECVAMPSPTPVPKPSGAPATSSPCPDGYVYTCSAICTCISQSGGTHNPGTGFGDEDLPGGDDLGRERNANGTVCNNNFECFWVDQLPYALLSLAVILVIFAIVWRCCCHRFCPRFWCNVLTCKCIRKDKKQERRDRRKKRNLRRKKKALLHSKIGQGKELPDGYATPPDLSPESDVSYESDEHYRYEAYTSNSDDDKDPKPYSKDSPQFSYAPSQISRKAKHKESSVYSDGIWKDKRIQGHDKEFQRQTERIMRQHMQELRNGKTDTYLAAVDHSPMLFAMLRQYGHDIGALESDDSLSNELDGSGKHRYYKEVKKRRSRRTGKHRLQGPRERNRHPETPGDTDTEESSITDVEEDAYTRSHEARMQGKLSRGSKSRENSILNGTLHWTLQNGVKASTNPFAHSAMGLIKAPVNRGAGAVSHNHSFDNDPISVQNTLDETRSSASESADFVNPADISCSSSSSVMSTPMQTPPPITDLRAVPREIDIPSRRKKDSPALAPVRTFNPLLAAANSMHSDANTNRGSIEEAQEYRLDTSHLGKEKVEEGESTMLRALRMVNNRKKDVERQSVEEMGGERAEVPPAAPPRPPPPVLSGIPRKLPPKILTIPRKSTAEKVSEKAEVIPNPLHVAVLERNPNGQRKRDESEKQVKSMEPEKSVEHVAIAMIEVEQLTSEASLRAASAKNIKSESVLKSAYGKLRKNFNQLYATTQQSLGQGEASKKRFDNPFFPKQSTIQNPLNMTKDSLTLDIVEESSEESIDIGKEQRVSKKGKRNKRSAEVRLNITIPDSEQSYSDSNESDKQFALTNAPFDASFDTSSHAGWVGMKRKKKQEMAEHVGASNQLVRMNPMRHDKDCRRNYKEPSFEVEQDFSGQPKYRGSVSNALYWIRGELKDLECRYQDSSVSEQSNECPSPIADAFDVNQSMIMPEFLNLDADSEELSE